MSNRDWLISLEAVKQELSFRAANECRRLNIEIKEGVDEYHGGIVPGYPIHVLEKCYREMESSMVSSSQLPTNEDV